MDSSTSSLWKDPFPIEGMSLLLLSLSFAEIPVFIVNSVDPDQTLRSVASDLGLHCLTMSRLWDARCKGLRKISKLSREVTVSI